MELKDLDSYHLFCLVCKCPDTQSSYGYGFLIWISGLVS